MANNDLYAMLNAANESEQNHKSGNNNGYSDDDNPFAQMVTAASLDSIENQIFGPSETTDDDESNLRYDAYRDFENIKTRKNANKKITNPILLAVMQDGISETHEQINNFAENISKNLNNDNLTNAKKVQEQLDEYDRQKYNKGKNLNEDISSNMTSTVFNEDDLRRIIEEVMEKKLTQFLQAFINNNKMTMMMIGNEFKLVDNQGIIYRCGDFTKTGKRMTFKK